MNTIVINNLSELSVAANKLLKLSEGKKIFTVNGVMGAGKTTFIKAVCEALGVKDTISSPTFSLVNEYTTSSGEKVYHFDFYRIKDINEAYDMGFEEYVYSNAYCFIEWPDMIAELLPSNVLQLNISVKEGLRIIEF